MATLDRRPQYTKNDEETLDSNEEVKEPESEKDEGVEDDQGGSSAPKQPDGEPEAEEETIGDDTSLKTVAPAAAKEAVEVQDEVSDEDKVNALKLEEERLRKQISELRQERRKVKENPVFVDKKPEDDLKDVPESDVQLIEKVIRAKGFVRRDELQQMTYQEKLESFKDEWLRAHPEYLPENDPEDKRWTVLKSHVDSYFKAPSDPKEVVKILDLAHQMVGGIAKRPLGVKDKASNQAAQEKLSSQSKAAAGGGSQQKVAVSKESSKRIDPSMVKYLDGFSDEEIKELTT